MVDADYAHPSIKSLVRKCDQLIMLAVFECKRIKSYQAEFIRICPRVGDFWKELATILQLHMDKLQTELRINRAREPELVS